MLFDLTKLCNSADSIICNDYVIHLVDVDDDMIVLGNMAGRYGYACVAKLPKDTKVEMYSDGTISPLIVSGETYIFSFSITRRLMPEDIV